jgi:hypothetical protein
MIGALGSAVADALLFGNATNGRTFRARQLDNLSTVSPGRLLAGHLLGIFMIPLMACGIGQMLLAMQPAGLPVAAPIALFNAWLLVIGGAAHACFAPLGLALQGRSRGRGETGEIDLVVARLRRQLEPVFGVFLVSLLAFSVWFGVIVWSRETFYPRWMAFVNPATLHAAVSLLADRLPAPGGGFVAAAGGTIAMFLFFLVSTLVLA